MLQADNKPYDTDKWDAVRKDTARARALDGLQPSWYSEHALQRLYTCGIYAVKHEVQKQLIHEYDPDVLGDVHLWGRVAVFERGYRAEFCVIRELYVRQKAIGAERKRMLAELSDRYQCPVSVIHI